MCSDNYLVDVLPSAMYACAVTLALWAVGDKICVAGQLVRTAHSKRRKT